MKSRVGRRPPGWSGRSDMSTTQRYIDLAGVSFRAEAELAESCMFGATAEE